MTLRGWTLLVAALAVGLLYMLPLAFAPLRFARLAGWRVATDDALAIYFGRCLGAVIAVLVALAAYAVFVPAYEPVALATTTGATALMVVVHAVGMIEKKQPRFETIEGTAWLAAAIYLGWLYSQS